MRKFLKAAIKSIDNHDHDQPYAPTPTPGLYPYGGTPSAWAAPARPVSPFPPPAPGPTPYTGQYPPYFPPPPGQQIPAHFQAPPLPTYVPSPVHFPGPPQPQYQSHGSSQSSTPQLQPPLSFGSPIPPQFSPPLSTSPFHPQSPVHLSPSISQVASPSLPPPPPPPARSPSVVPAVGEYHPSHASPPPAPQAYPPHLRPSGPQAYGSFPFGAAGAQPVPAPPTPDPPMHSQSPPMLGTPEERVERRPVPNVERSFPQSTTPIVAPVPLAPQRIPRVSNAPTVRKILSLDGGGVRGLSTIIILRYLMQHMEQKRGFPLEPWQEFDMIGGTSTGGLLAIMLGRLRMSLEECEAAYLQLSKDIFKPSRNSANIPGKVYDFLQANGKFDSQPLESNIRSILKAHEKPEDELLREDHEDACKVFVCAVRQDDSTAVIRSYRTRANDRLHSICKIWEAARATSAASRLFEPITIGPFNQKFVDGGLRHNNPIDLVDIESEALWPKHDRLIISIGTGIAPGRAVNGNLMSLIETLAKIVTDSEERNRIFRTRHPEMISQNRLYRFNVDQGLNAVGLEEYQAVDLIATTTDRYLDDPDVVTDMEKCAEVMKDGGQRLNMVGGEELVEIEEAKKLGQLMCTNCEHCLQGVPFSNHYFYCMECDMDICEICQRRHDYAHLSKLLRLEGHQWKPRIAGIAPMGMCRNCSGERKARIECKDCFATICFDCSSSKEARETFHTNHREQKPTEKTFVVIYPPYWSVLPQIRSDCACATLAGVFGHCGICRSAMFVSQPVYWCRTCRVDYGGAPQICQSCWSNHDPDHREAHEFQVVKTATDSPPEDDIEKQEKTMVRCSDCSDQSLRIGTVAYHPHPNVWMVFGTYLAELLRIISIRQCPSFRNRNPTPLPPNPSKFNCALCELALPYGTLGAVCMTAKCQAVFCHECYFTNRHHHRHPLSTVNPQKVTDQHRSCNLCKVEYSIYVGLMCSQCRNYDICGTCISSARNGKITFPQGPHDRCTGSSWVFYMVEKQD
ncbi:MAG: hypothetical protein M1826_002587 [Phylliscum demangeonii]|nr:MAG: hypothetical protein M1826_002587 [Phylliscum demangeonii]